MKQTLALFLIFCGLFATFASADSKDQSISWTNGHLLDHFFASLDYAIEGGNGQYIHMHGSVEEEEEAEPATPVPLLRMQKRDTESEEFKSSKKNNSGRTCNAVYCSDTLLGITISFSILGGILFIGLIILVGCCIYRKTECCDTGCCRSFRNCFCCCC